MAHLSSATTGDTPIGHDRKHETVDFAKMVSNLLLAKHERPFKGHPGSRHPAKETSMNKPFHRSKLKALVGGLALAALRYR